jgi:predicted aspartyl protease
VVLFARNGSPRKSVTIDALVDTGATFSAFPADLLIGLGVQKTRQIRARLADGSLTNWEMGEVEAEIDGERSPILVVFGAPEAPPLLGAHALEAFLLTVDPIERRLKPHEAFFLVARVTETR